MIQRRLPPGPMKNEFGGVIGGKGKGREFFVGYVGSATDPPDKIQNTINRNRFGIQHPIAHLALGVSLAAAHTQV